MKITYTNFQQKDFDSLLKMSLQLWEDIEEQELRKLLLQSCEAENQKIIFAKNIHQESVGFAIFSIRKDYVEGATQSPTGYLEGIFVEKEYRKSGIAKTLVQSGEKWLKENNCTQIGSDTWLSDINSRNFHRQLGFWEEEELVHFLKDIE